MRDPDRIEKEAWASVSRVQEQPNDSSWFVSRWFHSLPIGRKATYIQTEVTRVECKDCGTVRQADIGFADPRLTYIKALGRYVLDLAKYMTISDVSRHLALSWEIIKSMQKR